MPTLRRRGRPSALQKIWNFLGGLTKGQPTGLRGTKDPLVAYRSGARHTALRYDLEVETNVVRRPDINYSLVELHEWCYEARHAVSILVNDCFSSQLGDELNWRVSPLMANGETPTHPDILAIDRDLRNRMVDKERVIGGDFLKRALRECLGIGCGDSFLELGIGREGLGRQGDWGISDSLYLPPLEMFVDKNAHGRLEGYEQRETLHTSDPVRWEHEDVARIIHFSYEPQTLYGQSIFRQSLEPWERLKQVNSWMVDALISAAIIPKIHTLPEGSSPEQVEAYKQAYSQSRKDRIITDIYLNPGATVQNMVGNQSNLKGLLDEQLDCRLHVIPAGLPIYFFPGLGLEQSSSREVSQEPARLYGRMRHGLCALMADRIKFIMDLEICLRRGFDFLQEHRDYQIVFPQWSDPWSEQPRSPEAAGGPGAGQGPADPGAAEWRA